MKVQTVFDTLPLFLLPALLSVVWWSCAHTQEGE